MTKINPAYIIMSFFPFVIEKLLVLQVHFRDIIPYSSYLRSVLFISRLHYNISRGKEHILPPGKEAFGVYNIKSAVPKDGKRLFDSGVEIIEFALKL